MAPPMKVGLIGTGGISNRHMIPYLERPDRVRLTAVCDIVESLAQDYAKRAGVDEIYLDFEEMLQKADIDAVDICTGHSSHAPLAIAAANAGKHVIVEKAMAHTLQGCKDMIDAADKAGGHPDGCPAPAVLARIPRGEAFHRRGQPRRDPGRSDPYAGGRWRRQAAR